MDNLLLRIAPLAAILVVTGPVLAGLSDIFGPAFGHVPSFGHHGFSLEPFHMVFSTPGIWKSIWLSFWMGPATVLAALTITIIFTAGWVGTRWFNALLTLIRPVLAVPHAAAAFGLALLIMPAGFLVRLVSPELSGFMRPPDWLVINDPAGFSLFFGLVIKELPFLFLVTLSALPQANTQRAKVGLSLGHGQVWSWLISVFPAVYAQIRLPVFAVLVFSSSVVDVALILGPGTPPPLAVLILRWMNDPDLDMRMVAAAAAIVQLGVTGFALLTWWGIERFIGWFGRCTALTGARFTRDKVIRWAGLIAAGLSALTVFAGIMLLGLASVSGIWRFPDTLPSTINLMTWAREAPNLLSTGGRSLFIGLTASLIAVVVVIGCLENEYRRDKGLTPFAKFILFLPLLVPQISFLPGLTIRYLILFGTGETLGLVIMSHLVFVLPYVYLTLADPWNGFDRRYLDAARGLGKGRNHVLFSIRLPMLLRPVLTALAIGFAVSMAQYLPTLLIGAGREPTITTEAVALASGGNRRLIGVYGLTQSLLPYAMFAIAALIPMFAFRNRRGLQPGYGHR